MNPFTPVGRRGAEARARRILEALRTEDVLSDEAYELAIDQIGRLRIPRRGSRPAAALHAVLRLSERVRKDKVHSQILHTTLDLDLQEEVTWAAWEELYKWQPRGAQNGAVIVVDRASNEVLAFMGSTYYFDEERAGAIDYTAVARSSGSTLKRFLYGLALEMGAVTPPRSWTIFRAALPRSRTPTSSTWAPMLLRTALGNSRNIPAADVLEMVGIDEGYDFLGEIGLHDGVRSARHYGLGLAIGTLPVTLERLVEAYTVLAGDGHYRELLWYRGQSVAPPKRVLSENTVRQVTLFLSDPMARLPTFPRMGVNEYPFPVAVKTGTSSNYRDAWTGAYSSRYLVSVWIGRPDYRPMARLSGYRAASPLARRILMHLHEADTDGLKSLSFPAPRSARASKLCALTGLRATDACERVTVEWLAPGEEPVDACSAHVRLAVDLRSGSLANAATPAALTEVRTFVQLSPRYAAWASTAGLPRPPLGTLPMMRRDPRIALTSPVDGLRLLPDPETPASMATLALRAVVDPPSQQIVWYVDGEPFQVVAYPYAARWPLEPGEHRFQIRLPHTDVVSNVVKVWVQ